VEARQGAESVNLPIHKGQIPADMSKYAMPIPQGGAGELAVILAIDVSGSMIGTPLHDAKTAMISFIRKMDLCAEKATKVGIIAVANWAERVIGLSSDPEACITAINRINVGLGGTNDGHPFDLIREMLRHESGRRFAIVLADGMWNSRDVAAIAARQCNAEGIETAAIGFGKAQQEFLNSLASSDANALMVEQSELTSAFGSIAQSLGGGRENHENASDTETWEI
jgi:molecular chaperone DnaK